MIQCNVYRYDTIQYNQCIHTFMYNTITYNVIMDNTIYYNVNMYNTVQYNVNMFTSIQYNEGELQYNASFAVPVQDWRVMVSHTALDGVIQLVRAALSQAVR